jgi:hypothetical protein
MINVLIALVTSPWGRRLLGLVSILGAAGAGYAYGRYSVPPKVETRVVTIPQIQVVKVRASVKQRERVTRTTTTPTPAGPVTTTETTERESTHTNTDTNTHAEGITLATRTATGSASPGDWRVGVLLGAGGTPGSAASPSLLVGPQVEFRIPRTPVYLGGWGLVGVQPGATSKGVTSWAAGGSLSVSF